MNNELLFMMRKRIDESDYSNILSGNSVILGLRFENNDVVKGIIEKMKNEVLGLNLKTENQFYVQRPKEEIQVHKLPSSSKFDSLKQLTEWAAYQHIPDMRRELGTISANEDTIVLNLNHSISDGKYIAGVANHICDNTTKPIDSYFPITFDDEFAEEIKKRLQNPPKFYDNDPNNTIFSNFGMKRVEHEILHDSCFDTKTFANYDAKKRKCDNLTASTMTRYSLCLSALENNENIDHLGGSLAVDMRNALKFKKANHIKNLLDPNLIHTSTANEKDLLTLNHANFFTIVPAAVSVSATTSIEECYKRINDNIQKQTVTNKSNLFDLRCSMGFKNPKEKSKGVMAGFSNLGKVHVKRPVTDLYIFNIDFNIVFPYIILFTYSIIDEKTNRNDFHAQVRYECNGLTKEQAYILSKSFKYYLETAKYSKTIGDAFNELKEFQKELK